MLRSTAIRFLLSFTAALIISCSAAAQQNPSTLATVNGKAITTQDLEQKEVNRLLQAQYQYYQAERKALDDLIVQRLLEEEAQRQGISTDDLLKREVDSKVKDPNEDQLQVYYEGLDSKEPYDQVREKITGTHSGLAEVQAALCLYRDPSRQGHHRRPTGSADGKCGNRERSGHRRAVRCPRPSG